MLQHGIGKKDLAIIAGVGPSAVTKWSNGGAIRIQSVHRIAQHFDIDPLTIIQADYNHTSLEVEQSEIDWKARALKAEAKLNQLRAAIRNFTKVVENLEGAL